MAQQRSPLFHHRLLQTLGRACCGLKGIDLVLRLAHCPDRRNSWYLEGQSAAIWSGPTFELATNSFTEWTTFFYGSQDRLIHRWIKDHARPDWVCVDVGMNFGFFTCLCGQLCLEVHGFEPVASLVARAKRNCGLNNLTNVIFNELALADTIGELRFNLPREDSCNLGTGSLVHAGQGTIVTVRAATLDDYCQRAGMTRLDFAKIDVEGAEHLVLRGGGNALQVFRPAIIFEWNADSFDEVRRILIRHRYRIHDLKGRSLDKPRCRADALTNMLALPE